jgi:nicotinate-nucleotide adenylyltransferase
VERLGIFGGTFDPIHIGHLIVATEMRFRLALARVLFVPAGHPPHKPESSVSSVADRVEMVNIAIRHEDDFAICTYEAERPGPSYSVDTLTYLRETYPESELYFIIGEDSLRDLPTWRQPRRILQLAYVAVAARPGPVANVDSPEHPLFDLRDRIIRVRVPLIDVSSRELRRRVTQGEPIRYQVLPEVEAFIRERGLYEPDGAAASRSGAPGDLS